MSLWIWVLFLAYFRIKWLTRWGELGADLAANMEKSVDLSFIPLGKSSNLRFHVERAEGALGDILECAESELNW